MEELFEREGRNKSFIRKMLDQLPQLNKWVLCGAAVSVCDQECFSFI